VVTQPTEPAAEPDDYAHVFSALVFPISKPGILQKATDRGGIDSEVVDTLRQLPDRTYVDDADVRAEVQPIYLARGLPHEQLPL
jgi:hypothetical protein